MHLPLMKRNTMVNITVQQNTSRFPAEMVHFANCISIPFLVPGSQSSQDIRDRARSSDSPEFLESFPIRIIEFGKLPHSHHRILIRTTCDSCVSVLAKTGRQLASNLRRRPAFSFPRERRLPHELRCTRHAQTDLQFRPFDLHRTDRPVAFAPWPPPRRPWQM
jgi:hypothetical protein